MKNDCLYSLLNSRILSILRLNNYDISHYRVTSEIAKLILKLGIDKPLYSDIESIDVLDIDAILEDFFRSISDELLDNYLNVRRETYARFISIKDNNEKTKFVEENFYALSIAVRKRYMEDALRTSSYMDKHGDLTIVLDGTINDLFTISHEYMHKIFYQKIGEPDTYNNINFLVEIASSVIELILADYLIEHDLYKSSAFKHKYNSFIFLVSTIYKYLFEMMLIEIYIKNGEVTEKNLNEYILSLEEPYKSKFLEMMNDRLALIARDRINIDYYNRYIIAVFVSYYLKDEFKDVNAMFKLGTNIYKNNFVQALKASKIDFIQMTNIFSRLFGNNKYEKNENKIEEIYQVLVREYDKCVKALDGIDIVR